MKPPSIRPVRCAIYTRVSTEHGLDQEFNSLDAQYDAASAYIKSQAHAGWRGRSLPSVHVPNSAFIHTGLTRARGSMFTHFTPADLIAILNIPRLQTLPNSFKILREYRLSVVALVQVRPLQSRRTRSSGLAR